MLSVRRSDGPVVVTGATGFLGRYLSSHLLAGGRSVRGVARSRAFVNGVEPHVISGFDDRARMAAAMEGASAVVHLAGRAHVTGESERGAFETYRRVNARGTAIVLEEAARAGVGRFVLASSVLAVGVASGSTIWDESTEPRPEDPYGQSKLEAERIVLSGPAADAVDGIALRLPLVYGPGVRANMLALFRAVARRFPLPLGGISNRRSFLYVGNLVTAISHLLSHEAEGRGVYFLTDGQDLSTPDLVRKIGKAIGRNPILIPVPEDVLRGIGRACDCVGRLVPLPLGLAQVDRLTSSLVVSPSLFFAQFDFSPPWSVERGLEVTARWFRSAGR